MAYCEFFQWSWTLCQLALAGFGGFCIMRTSIIHRPREELPDKTMQKNCLSLESSYIPVKARRETLERDGYKCVWCGKREKHDVSLFIQKCAGGEISRYNVVTTCKVCKRNRQYLKPSEFILKLTLEKLDVLKELGMVIKVIRPSGQEITGEVADLPNPDARAFYLKHIGNGTRELIFVEPGMRIVELAGRDKEGES